MTPLPSAAMESETPVPDEDTEAGIVDNDAAQLQCNCLLLFHCTVKSVFFATLYCKTLIFRCILISNF